MACEVLQLSGWIDSDHLLDTTGTDHVAGQAVALTTDGKAVLATDPDDVVGLFKNDMADDLATGPQAADAVVTSFCKGAFVSGQNKYRLSIGTLRDGTTQLPFKYPGTNTWAIKNRVYLGANGLWDNAPENANEQPFGIVTKAPSDDDQTLEFISTCIPAPFHSTLST